METFGLAIAWEWEFDQDFVRGIEQECRTREISTYAVAPRNLAEVIRRVERNELAFQALYDRASDGDEAFLRLVKLLAHPSLYTINPHDRVAHAIDKATMHLEFITHGIFVPNTVILSPYSEVKELQVVQADIDRLGKPFVIKPANTTGGGTGVVLNARTVEDIRTARAVHPGDKYLLQEFVHPRNLNGRRAWFRVYSVFDESILCWWDDQTHEYTEMTGAEEEQFALGGLREVIRTIQSICRLDFFSSEIAQDQSGTFVVVDYVNEICDMRLKSKYHNGAPDAVVHRIERLIAESVGRQLARLRMDPP